MITIYTTSICPRCKLLKAWLKDHKIPFAEKSLEDDAESMTEMRVSGYFGVEAPIIESPAGSYYGPGEMFVGGNVDEKKMREIV
jgi:glutaredoxin